MLNLRTEILIIQITKVTCFNIVVIRGVTVHRHDGSGGLNIKLVLFFIKQWFIEQIVYRSLNKLNYN